MKIAIETTASESVGLLMEYLGIHEDINDRFWAHINEVKQMKEDHQRELEEAQSSHQRDLQLAYNKVGAIEQERDAAKASTDEVQKRLEESEKDHIRVIELYKNEREARENDAARYNKILSEHRYDLEDARFALNKVNEEIKDLHRSKDQADIEHKSFKKCLEREMTELKRLLHEHDPSFDADSYKDGVFIGDGIPCDDDNDCIDDPGF